MFHGFSASSRNWLLKNYVITASFVSNRFSMQMFQCWLSNYKCARSFFMQGVGIALLSNFFTFRFFISLIQRLSFFSIIIRIFICMGVLSQVLLFNWLVLSVLWFLSFSFSPVITVRWLLLAVDVAVLFIVYWSVWVLTSVFLDVIIRMFRYTIWKVI